MKQRLGYGGGRGDFETPSSHLWVGNLPPDVSEPYLSELFGKHGPLDGITSYASRGYAFVYYKRVEDATAAKNALQGFLIRGNPLKIQFAKLVCSDLFCASMVLGLKVNWGSIGIYFCILCNRNAMFFISFSGVFWIFNVCLNCGQNKFLVSVRNSHLKFAEIFLLSCILLVSPIYMIKNCLMDANKISSMIARIDEAGENFCNFSTLVKKKFSILDEGC